MLEDPLGFTILSRISGAPFTSLPGKMGSNRFIFQFYFIGLILGPFSGIRLIGLEGMASLLADWSAILSVSSPLVICRSLKSGGSMSGYFTILYCALDFCNFCILTFSFRSLRHLFPHF